MPPTLGSGPCGHFATFRCALLTSSCHSGKINRSPALPRSIHRYPQAMLTKGMCKNRCGAVDTTQSKSYMDMASNLFTFTFTFTSGHDELTQWRHPPYIGNEAWATKHGQRDVGNRTWAAKQGNAWITRGCRELPTSTRPPGTRHTATGNPAPTCAHISRHHVCMQQQKQSPPSTLNSRGLRRASNPNPRRKQRRERIQGSA